MDVPLLKALEDFLNYGRAVVAENDSQRAERTLRLVLDESDLIRALLQAPVANLVGTLAAVAAEQNGWEGRPFDAETLQFCGLARALAQRRSFEVHRCAIQLAQYLAGPVGPVEEWVALSADVPPRRCLVAAGWEFGRFSSDELTSVLPVPEIANAVGRHDPFRPDVWHQVAFLRRPCSEEPPDPSKIYLNFGPDRELDELWEPLLALALWSNHPTGIAGRWIIEPGVAYREERRPTLDFVPPAWPDVDDEIVLADWERLYRVHESEWASFIAFQSAVARRLGALPAGRSRQRLQYATRHFLAATSLGSGPGADVWQEESAAYPERTLEALFRYCATLEGVVGDAAGDLTRKVSQRSAVLTELVHEARLPMFSASDDETEMTGQLAEALVVEKLVRAAYEGRSRFSHGDEPPKEVWKKARIPQLRSIARAVLVGRLILGWSGKGDVLPARCDEALLSQGVRQELRDQVEAFASEVEAGASKQSVGRPPESPQTP